MSKVILFNLATLDGFFAGPNGEIDWHHVDEEFNDFAIAQLNSAAGERQCRGGNRQAQTAGGQRLVRLRKRESCSRVDEPGLD